MRARLSVGRTATYARTAKPPAHGNAVPHGTDFGARQRTERTAEGFAVQNEHAHGNVGFAEWVGGVSYPWISMNKHNVFQICSVTMLLLLLLANRGGEGEKERSEAVVVAEGWRVFSSALVRWRGVKRSSMKPSAVLPKWKTTEFAFVMGPLDKRRCCLLQGHHDVSALLADRGGEGEELGSSWSSATASGDFGVCSPFSGSSATV
ncbi:hypothetical protein QYE76_036769 [Lolium multiflorum]|uniref:Uncharacterized protein n=1 Tax=Lolium multiflorum TaxID=4521 RepID=A0AAD8R2F4_LOLMU|nr:hypothetical protein QYE76_036769 [Lolium multiflorum]